ncbi:MAG: hypothetical protein AAB089_00800, partial [Nitrospirota bacterium]
MSFLPRIKVRDKLQQESRKTKENTGCPLNTCGNDRTLVIPHVVIPACPESLFSATHHILLDESFS